MNCSRWDLPLWLGLRTWLVSWAAKYYMGNYITYLDWARKYYMGFCAHVDQISYVHVLLIQKKSIKQG